MASTNDTTTDTSSGPQNDLEQHLEAERRKLMQAYAVLICLREVLLYADHNDAVIYAEAANTAAELVNRAVAQLDPSTLQLGVAKSARSLNHGDSLDGDVEPIG